MVFSQSQFYDIVQYAESMGLDPKIFSHEIIRTFKRKILGIEQTVNLDHPYSKFRIRETKYFFVYREYDRNNSNFHYVSSNDGQSFPLDSTAKMTQSNYDYKAIIHMSPAENKLEHRYFAFGFKKHFKWDAVYKWAKIWVNNLVDEIHAIESLERINSVPLFFTDSRTYNDFGTSFNPQQASVLRDKIYLLKSSIVEEIPLNETQFSIINEKLDELAKKVDKVSKFDFRTLFFGILTNLASSVLYDEKSVFWKLVRKIFSDAALGDGSADLLS